MKAVFVWTNLQTDLWDWSGTGLSLIWVKKVEIGQSYLPKRGETDAL